jgi:hypothetical protein
MSTIEQESINNHDLNKNLYKSLFYTKNFNAIEIMSGSKYAGKTFYKVIDKTWINNNFKYKLGLNILPENMNVDEFCSTGFHFCILEKVVKNLELHENGIVVEVTLPSDALVCELNKNSSGICLADIYIMYKTNKIIISTPLPFDEFIEKHCLHEQTIDYVTNGMMYIKYQTDEDCIRAVKKSSYNLRYIKNPTFEVCLIAIQKDPYLLQSIKIQEDRLCIFAVSLNGLVLQFVKKQTSIIQQNTEAFKYVKNQTAEICLEAVRLNPLNLQYVNYEYLNICFDINKKLNN